MQLQTERRSRAPWLLVAVVVIPLALVFVLVNFFEAPVAPPVADWKVEENDKSEQGALAAWLSRRYRVSPLFMTKVVKVAYEANKEYGIDSHLLLAIAAIESSFNPYAESRMGARGLMQVLPSAHPDKVEPYKEDEMFLPEINLRLGAQVLAQYLESEGSLELALKKYVGRSDYEDDGGYRDRINEELERIKEIARRQRLMTVL